MQYSNTLSKNNPLRVYSMLFNVLRIALRWRRRLSILVVRSREKDFAVDNFARGDQRFAAEPRPNKCLDHIFLS